MFPKHARIVICGTPRHKNLASGKGFEPIFHRSKRCVLPIDEPEKKLEALVRFELTTSRFVILRSQSVELQSRLDFGFWIADLGFGIFQSAILNLQSAIVLAEGRGLEPLCASSTAAFKAVARPIWRAFHKLNRDLKFGIWDFSIRNPQSAIPN